MSARVYIAQEGPFDYTSAEDYGQLEFCSVQEITPTKGGQLNENIIRNIRKKMINYIPGRDYILLSGSPIAIAHCLSIAFNMRNVPIEHNILKWDGQRGAYVEYKIEG